MYHVINQKYNNRPLTENSSPLRLSSDASELPHEFNVTSDLDGNPPRNIIW